MYIEKRCKDYKNNWTDVECWRTERKRGHDWFKWSLMINVNWTSRKPLKWSCDFKTFGRFTSKVFTFFHFMQALKAALLKSRIFCLKLLDPEPWSGFLFLNWPQPEALISTKMFQRCKSITWIQSWCLSLVHFYSLSKVFGKCFCLSPAFLWSLKNWSFLAMIKSFQSKKANRSAAEHKQHLRWHRLRNLDHRRRKKVTFQASTHITADKVDVKYIAGLWHGSNLYKIMSRS